MSQLKIFQKMGKTKLGRFIIKGGATLAIGAALAAGIGCNSEDIPVQVIIEDPNPVNNPGEEEVTKPGEEVSDKPGDVVEPVEPEEVKEEIDRYAQVPEEELDENGKYIPVDVTADMLRERFDEIEEYVDTLNLSYDKKELYSTMIESTLLKANYPFVSDEDFMTIVKEEDIVLDENNYHAYYLDIDVAPESLFFDPYLQYESRMYYDLNYNQYYLWLNNNQTVDDKIQSEYDYYNDVLDSLVDKGKYEDDDEIILVPFDYNNSNVVLGSKYDKDPNICLCYMQMMQHGGDCRDYLTYKAIFMDIDNTNPK